jgi:hypothetical protein
LIGSELFITIKTNDNQAATIGLFLVIEIFGFFIGFQQNYAATHAEDLKNIENMKKEMNADTSPNVEGHNDV